MDKKVTSCLAYATLIGLAVAYFAGDNRGAMFHLNQAFVIHLMIVACVLLAAIPLIGLFIGIAGGAFCILCFALGLRAAIHQEERRVPLIGSIQLIR